MRVFVVMISMLAGVMSQKNLARNGTASQSSTFYYVAANINLTADLAINGGPTDTFTNLGCSITWWKPFQRFAWWMLTFPVDTVYITNVKIYYRSNTPQNIAGYSLYISNSSTSKTGGYLCYHDTGISLPSVNQDVTCNHLGKNVIFYNERNTSNNPLGESNFAIVELCYIEVNGCYKGWWDSSCSKPCPVTCVSGHCYPGNGNCVWGCNPDNCLNDICDTATGKCTQGCKIGLRGNYCDTACAPGTYGNQCSSMCHCVNQPCDLIHGTCPDGGCQQGYKGNTCSTECSLGHYGYNCNQSCDGCLSVSCDKEHGVCTNTTGCKPGRQYGHTWKCDIVCISGTFGDGCSSNCYCINQPCDPEHGTCPAGGCERGYKGSTCSTECILGDYGYNCDQSCGGCLSDSCESKHGFCIDQSGCKPGWQYGQPGKYKCDIVCVSGTFGNDCSSNCYCINQPCDPEHGTCPAGGCERGYEGSTCSTECSLGNYGYNCNQLCDGCLSDSCDKANGVCTDTTGCKPGWQYGHAKCDIACISATFGDDCFSNCYCINQPCNPEHGICPAGGCQRGYKGSTCSTECARGDYGYDCEHHCRICVNSSCERYEGHCTHGCTKKFKGHQCQSAATPQSDGQTTKDNTMTVTYAVIGTFIVTALVCVIIFLTILRYRRQKANGNTKKQGGQKSSEFRNDAFTNDYTNTMASNTETHYEDTIHSDQEQDETYDTI